jgi:hypothetical protein
MRAGDAFDLQPQLRKPLLVAFCQVAASLLIGVTAQASGDVACNEVHLLALL